MALHLKDENGKPIKRVRNRGHVLLRDRPRGVWYPDLVGVVHAYPPTYEAWLKKQRIGIENIKGQTRAGTPNGWGGPKKRKVLMRLRAERDARVEKKMEEIKKVIEFADYRAEKAMEATLEVMEYKDDNGKRLGDPRNILMAARLIFEYTQPKPASKSEVTVKSAEDWLASLGE
jgi:hypothetical protein